MENISMLMGIWDDIRNLVMGFIAIIPQTLYFLFACASTIIDTFQFACRKVAGLDSYYLTTDGGKTVEKTGDIATYFVEGILGINSDYSIFSTVFWSLVIFGVVLLVFATIIAIIKTHYNYNSEKSRPMKFISQAIKGLLTMVIIPVTTLFGMQLSNALLATLDNITSGMSKFSLTSVYEKDAIQNFAKDDKSGIYTSYDVFGVPYYTNSYSFTSSIFASAMYNCNRVRSGNFTAVVGENNTNWSNAGVFWTSQEENTSELIANQIDMAFEYNLRLTTPQDIEFQGDAQYLITSYTNLNAVYAFDLKDVKSFSKFKVGLVYYYYDLWAFDFFLGYAGIFTVLTLMFNILLGLVSRLFTLVVLFFVFPPITGLFPIDDGNAVKSWRTSYVKSFIAVYGTVIALNLMSIIMPFLKTITFFDPKMAILNNILNSLFAIVALVATKKIIAVFSNFIGADSLEKVGSDMAKEFRDTTLKAIGSTLMLAGGVGAGALNSLNSSKNLFTGALSMAKNKVTNHNIRKTFGKKAFSKISKDERARYAEMQEASRRQKIEEKNQKRQIERNKKLQKRADEILKEDKDKYVDRARAALEKEHPELFKKSKNKNGQLKIDSSKINQYKRLLAEKEKEYAMADAEKEYEQKLANKGLGKKLKNFIDSKPNIKSSIKEFKDDMLDLGKSMISVTGDITGIKGMQKAIEEAGIKDEAIKALKSYGKAMGLKTISLKTKKDKEDEEKEKVKAHRANIEKTAKIQESTTVAIESLTKKFQEYYISKAEKINESIKKSPKKPASPSGDSGSPGDKKGPKS